MRTMKTKLAGKPVTLTASFAASVRIAKEVADPLLISREIVRETIFSQQGLPYKPEWSMDITNVTQLITIGMQATDADVEEEAVQKMVFAEGYLKAQGIALDYLALLVEPNSVELVKEVAKKTKAAKRKSAPGK